MTLIVRSIKYGETVLLGKNNGFSRVNKLSVMVADRSDKI
jgi:hypothetical protein